GAALQGIAAAVTGLTLVTSDGSVVACSADEDPALFHAARVSLGALGIITEVELQCVPPFQLHAVEGSASIGEVLDSVDALAAANDHVDIPSFPHPDRCLLKRNTRVEASPPGAAGRPLSAWRETLDDRFLANTAYEQINRLATRRPGWV